jgi:hypothetical protein
MNGLRGHNLAGGVANIGIALSIDSDLSSMGASRTIKVNYIKNKLDSIVEIISFSSC